MIMSHNDNGNTVNLTATHVLKVEASVVNQDEIASKLGKFWDYTPYSKMAAILVFFCLLAN